MIPGIILLFHKSPIYMEAQEKNLKWKHLFPLCKTPFFLYEKRIKESPKFSWRILRYTFISITDRFLLYSQFLQNQFAPESVQKPKAAAKD